ncbi:hypothetical protein EDB89DRAFT_1906267 [Lactarius sanguifluus]|nr:hypothetical protein EDB89DRAFT_1906267 [Lactarius sanguifluus]
MPSPKPSPIAVLPRHPRPGVIQTNECQWNLRCRTLSNEEFESASARRVVGTSSMMNLTCESERMDLNAAARLDRVVGKPNGLTDDAELERDAELLDTAATFAAATRASGARTDGRIKR